MKNKLWIAITILLLTAYTGICRSEDGLVADYSFNEGSGTILHDSSGNGLDGEIHGAKWVKSTFGWALKFSGVGDYVDCGNSPKLKITGDMTILTLAKLTPSAFPESNTNWTLIDSQSFSDNGFMLRIEGTTATLQYISNQNGTYQTQKGRISLETEKFYQIAIVKNGQNVSYFIDGRPDVTFPVKDPLPASRNFKISTEGQSFNGLIDQVKVYNRALSADEIRTEYRKDATRHEKDTAWFGKLKVTPHIYLLEKQILAEIDTYGILPIEQGDEISVELKNSQGTIVQVKKLDDPADQSKCDAVFEMKNLTDGNYGISALRSNNGIVKNENTVNVDYSQSLQTIPSPNQKSVSVLKKTSPPPVVKIRVTKGGAFILNIRGSEYPVESSFSYPHGGENKLTESNNVKCESSWKITTSRETTSGCRISAEGNYYKLNRQISIEKSCVRVKDTFTNKTSEPVGIILNNQIKTKSMEFPVSYIAGGGTSNPGQSITEMEYNPTILLSKPDMGLGLVALDDVFVLQAQGEYLRDGARLSSIKFALDARASYTLEWAIYLNSTGDYYDFINAIRKDEGRNNSTVPGFAMIAIETPDRLLTDEYQKLRGNTVVLVNMYSSVRPPEDPSIWIENIELFAYPKLMDIVEAKFRNFKKEHPNLKIVFHIAHNNYATGTPETTFPDSRIFGADGKQTYYHDDELKYFSKERVEQGWRWWGYYPTLDNSFGREMM